MLDAGRPAFWSADSIDFGTLFIANLNTTLPFICMHEYECFSGGKSNSLLIESGALLAPSSLYAAFKCLHEVIKLNGLSHNN